MKFDNAYNVCICMCVHIGVNSYPSQPSGTNLVSTALSPNTAYHTLSIALGGRGVEVHTLAQLTEAVKEGMEEKERPYVVNVIMERESKRKAQKHDWLTQPTSKL